MGEILNHLNWIIKQFEFHAVTQDDESYKWCKQRLGDRSGIISEARWYYLHTAEGIWFFFRQRDDWLQFKLKFC